MTAYSDTVTFVSGGKFHTVAVDATGGSIVDSGGYRIHTFTSDGTFTPSGAMNVEVLVIAGGGGGGEENVAGGGGGGGLVHDSSHAVTAQGYSVTVGAGGAEGTGGVGQGTNGDNSVFDTITAVGGGGGAAGVPANGNNGGSGGGGSRGGSGGTGTQGDSGGGTGYGNDAGATSSNSASAYGAAGGGGAGVVGGVGTSSDGGDGGDGLQFDISGSNTYYAGGGGGARNDTGTVPAGGQGGGGAGAAQNTAAIAGTANTGGGGGGGRDATFNGADGGSGIVIIRYPIPDSSGIDPIISYTDTQVVTSSGVVEVTPIATYADTQSIDAAGAVAEILTYLDSLQVSGAGNVVVTAIMSHVETIAVSAAGLCEIASIASYADSQTVTCKGDLVTFIGILETLDVAGAGSFEVIGDGGYVHIETVTLGGGGTVDAIVSYIETLDVTVAGTPSAFIGPLETVSIEGAGSLATEYVFLDTVSFVSGGIIDTSDTYLIDGESLSYRKLVTIDGDAVSTETGIPLSININLPGVKAGGADVRLATLGDTPIAREIECIDVPNSDDVTIHYPFDTVASNDSQFYVYWGNAALNEPAADSTYGSEAVWDANYVYVSHMADLTTSTIKDSTSNGRASTKLSANNPVEYDAPFGKAQDFSSDYITIPDSTDFDFTDFTFEAYHYKDTDVNGSIMSKFYDGSARSWEFLDNTASDYMTGSVNAAGTPSAASATNSVPIQSWYHTALTHDDSSTSQWFVDGSASGSAIDIGAVNPNAAAVKIGDRSHASSRIYFDGKIAEIRISNILRSTGYISTTSNNTHNPTATGTAPFYLTFGAIESRSIGIIPVLAYIDSQNVDCAGIIDIELTYLETLTLDGAGSVTAVPVLSYADIAAITSAGAFGIPSTYIFIDMDNLSAVGWNVSKTIQDPLWKLSTQLTGTDVPTPFRHLRVIAPDHNDVDRTVFIGFLPQARTNLSGAGNFANLSGFDYAWYLTSQYIAEAQRITDEDTDPSVTITAILGGTDWAKTTGIEPYNMKTVTDWATVKKSYIFDPNASKWKSIQEICEHTNHVFVVKWVDTGSDFHPVAYFVHEDDIDTELDLPALVTITAPDSEFVSASKESQQVDKINRVVVKGANKITGVWYDSVVESAEVTAGEEIPIEYRFESTDLDTQAKADARAAELYAFYNTDSDTYTINFKERMDLELYQRIQFSGYADIATGVMRVISIRYGRKAADSDVEVVVTPDQNLSNLRALSRLLGDDFMNTQDRIKEQFFIDLTKIAVGTVQSVDGDEVVVALERDGGLVKGRALS